VSIDHTLLLTVPEAALIVGVPVRRLHALAPIPGALPDGLTSRLACGVRISGPRLMNRIGAGERPQETL
jgi:hypothetical protein